MLPTATSLPEVEFLISFSVDRLGMNVDKNRAAESHSSLARKMVFITGEHD
jgi:hypothetical protein